MLILALVALPLLAACNGEATTTGAAPTTTGAGPQYGGTITLRTAALGTSDFDVSGFITEANALLVRFDVEY